MNFKNILFTLVAFTAITTFTACSDDIFDHSKSGSSTGVVVISLADVNSDNLAGFDVQLRNTTTNSIFTETTDEQGMVIFTVAPGIYDCHTLK